MSTFPAEARFFVLAVAAHPPHQTKLAERQQKLAKVLAKLMKVAEQFNVAVTLIELLYFFDLTNLQVVITNQVMAKPDGGAAAYIL